MPAAEQLENCEELLFNFNLLREIVEQACAAMDCEMSFVIQVRKLLIYGTLYGSCVL